MLSSKFKNFIDLASFFSSSVVIKQQDGSSHETIHGVDPVISVAGRHFTHFTVMCLILNMNDGCIPFRCYCACWLKCFHETEPSFMQRRCDGRLLGGRRDPDPALNLLRASDPRASSLSPLAHQLCVKRTHHQENQRPKSHRLPSREGQKTSVFLTQRPDAASASADAQSSRQAGHMTRTECGLCPHLHSEDWWNQI